MKSMKSMNVRQEDWSYVVTAWGGGGWAPANWPSNVYALRSDARDNPDHLESIIHVSSCFLTDEASERTSVPIDCRGCLNVLSMRVFIRRGTEGWP
jgi:hypothetical protein